MEQFRDYGKPILPIFEGEAGHRAYMKIVTTPPSKYDAKEASRRAAENLHKQGLEL